MERELISSDDDLAENAREEKKYYQMLRFVQTYLTGPGLDFANGLFPAIAMNCLGVRIANIYVANALGLANPYINTHVATPILDKILKDWAKPLPKDYFYDLLGVTFPLLVGVIIASCDLGGFASSVAETEYGQIAVKGAVGYLLAKFAKNNFLFFHARPVSGQYPKEPINLGEKERFFTPRASPVSAV